MARAAYKTKQREAIRGACLGEQTHFTAYDLADKLEKQGTAVAMSTLYRELDRLVKEGRLSKFDTGARACYQPVGGVTGHLHLKCMSCGALQHADCRVFVQMREHMLAGHGFEVPNGAMLVGKCGKCRGEKH